MVISSLMSHQVTPSGRECNPVVGGCARRSVAKPGPSRELGLCLKGDGGRAPPLRPRETRANAPPREAATSPVRPGGDSEAFASETYGMNDRRTTRVLVVEDSPTQAKKLEIVLRSLGFEYEI